MDERRSSIRDVLKVNPICSARLGIPIFRYPLKRLCVAFIEDVPVLLDPDLFPAVPKPTFDAFEYAPSGLSAKINPDVLPRLATLAIRFMNVGPHMSPSFVDRVQSRRPVIHGLYTNKETDFDLRLAPLLPDYSHTPLDAGIIELLRSNAPPTPFQTKRHEATLSEIPDRVPELDSLIDSTTSLLRYLTKDRNQANAKILSPFRRLPPELLGEIFIWCSSLYGKHRRCLDPRALHWTLSHVCRKWRSVAVGTPEIWSRIILDFRDDWFLNGSRIHGAAFMLGILLD
ncbi:hypothetical protein EDD18DRAFT_1366703 [Armillaria luteobubalina]|uniref:F-box domain-containing protein n=1 Tax=Armillaria luteobubalina TaxID=153913 RepID=A0AA39P1R7_9AGAR|nr:hypothetical protein EDD18DRAFT_1366703 [Armillaria luteobubalina]